MFGKKECTTGDPIAPPAAHTARMRSGEIYKGEHWEPSIADYSMVPTKATDAALEAAKGWKRPEEVPQRKDCVGVLQTMSWPNRIAIHFVVLFILSFLIVVPIHGKNQSDEARRQKEKAEAYNQSSLDETEESAEEPMNLRRFWEEPSPISTLTSGPSTLASVIPVTTTFITRTRATSSERLAATISRR